ncbi:organic cation transporter protein [Plakobranchus ocellatus]|uniref:Organic cation transporter protein n=1 Tax=Plakobranchus ocellatus TaxID=259542 RepID=A0AAV4B846_9GAST|nr:organic cation transporter protein [Plakobranchus ocellatus]
MKFDDLLVAVGEFGSYQRRVYFLLCLPAILCGAQVLSAVFIMAMPSYRCKIPAYTNDTYKIQSSIHEDLVNMSIPLDSSSAQTASSTAFSKCFVYSDVLRATQKQSDLWTSAEGALSSSLWRAAAMNMTSGSNGKPERQRETEECHEWVYDKSEFDSTAMTEFDVVCEDTILRSICNSVVFVGALFGSVAMGIIADV